MVLQALTVKNLQVGSPLEQSIYVLLSKVAAQLEAIGNYLPHRFGRARIYGQRLQVILWEQVETRCPTRHPSPEPSAIVVPQEQAMNESPSVTNAAANAVEEQSQDAQEHNSAANGQSSSAEHAVPDPFANLFNIPAVDLNVAGMTAKQIDELLPTDFWLPGGVDQLFESNNLFDYEVRARTTRFCRPVSAVSRECIPRQHLTGNSSLALSRSQWDTSVFGDLLANTA